MRPRGNDRNFAGEWHEGFEDGGLRTDRAPSRLRGFGLPDHRLALAVVTEPARLQYRRQSDLLERRRQTSQAVRGGKGRRGDTKAADEILFGEPILGDRQYLRIGTNRKAGSEKRRRLCRHVLELVGDEIDIGGEAIER